MLTVRGLHITFTQYEAGLRQRELAVISDLDVDVHAGQLVAVVGASGSGKSLLAHAVLGILPSNARVGGELSFQGEPLTQARAEALRGHAIALIPQSISYLDPLLTVGRHLQRAAKLAGHPAKAVKQRMTEALARYELPPTTAQRYPFQLSGGMARRVLVAGATLGRAELLIADEPTPGLHPDIVAETLGHLRGLADEGRAVLLITHDLSAALRVADRIVVFYAGTTVEVASADDFQRGPEALRHPYTRALWQALPEHGFVPLRGAQPSPDNLPPGCLFADRCPLVTAACRQARPAPRNLRGGLVRCIHA
jgi:peptide/nickel transport system ATP-binding protein